MKRTITLLGLCATLAFSATATAQTSEGKPKFVYGRFSDNTIFMALSDNGKWALCTGGQNDQRINGVNHLVNVETGKDETVKWSDETETDAIGKHWATDVSDDGEIVVGGFDGKHTVDGEYMGKLGYWRRSTGKWTELKPLDGYYGFLTSVTADGHYAWAELHENTTNLYLQKRYRLKYDLTTGDTIGKPIVIRNVSEDPDEDIPSYANAAARRSSVTPAYYGWGDILRNTSATSWSDRLAGKNPNARIGEDGSGSIYCGTDDYGSIFLCEPEASPSREWKVQVDGIWYNFDEILKQSYGIDYYTYTGFDCTGTPMGISRDGSVIAAFISPIADSYVVTLPEPISVLCNRIDLLKSYTTTPAEGAAFTYMETMRINFSQEITPLGKKNCALLKDKDGKTVGKSIGFAADKANANQLVVTFMAETLKDGEEYHVVIPAGSVALAGNNTKTNRTDIDVKYYGRKKAPVACKSVYPEEHSQLARIDNSSNSVIMTFDAMVAVTDTASANLVEVDDEGEKVIAKLNVVAQDSMVAVVPASTQYLYLNKNYKVVLNAGAVTDLIGTKGTGNEKTEINYHGTYEREVSTDDATLFYEDFNVIANSLTHLMRYEGDHNTPTDEMLGWEFDKDNQPWNFSIRESTSSANYCAASTSMYKPAGQSDDWMVTPQLTIPDKYCTLTFLGQSYDEDKDDHVKVVIYTSDANITNLNAVAIANMKNKGDIYDFKLNMGDTQDGLDGEWTRYTIDLAKYSGKKIYIGFWNNNKNQSAIFIDDIEVKRNLKYLIAMTTPSSVVKKDQVDVAGRLTINDDATYKNITLTLNDAQGNVVDTDVHEGVNLTKGQSVRFSFSKPLPLTVAEINNYTIGIQLDDYTDVFKSSIKDLAFEPVKRVVLEENTGTTCPNCPLGILAIENLEKFYGDQFIPVSLHTYQGDPYGNGLSAYKSALGLSAAPSALINRSDRAYFPMTQNDDGDYVFSFRNGLWQDIVAQELNTPADVELSVSDLTHNESTDKLDLNINVTSALNLTNQFYSVFAVALEDSIQAQQENNSYAIQDPALGPWGKGGEYAVYGSAGPTIYHNDVVRTYYGDVDGTSIRLPQTMTAGKTETYPLNLTYPSQIENIKHGKLVLMLFDANKQKVLNSVRVSLNPDVLTGIKGNAYGHDKQCDINVNNGRIHVKGNGRTAVNVYSATGVLLKQAVADDNVEIDGTDLQDGILIVRATCGKSTSTKKVTMKKSK